MIRPLIPKISRATKLSRGVLAIWRPVVAVRYLAIGVRGLLVECGWMSVGYGGEGTGGGLMVMGHGM